MRQALRRLCPFILLFPSLWAEGFIPSELLKTTLSGNGPYVTLGIVSDSEQQSTISDDGIEIRKKMELTIQQESETITPLARSERMRLERLWSLPFTGRISDDLKKEIRTLGSGLVTGSYSPHDKESFMVLVLPKNDDRVLVFHEKQPKSSPSVTSGSNSNSTTKSPSPQHNVTTQPKTSNQPSTAPSANSTIKDNPPTAEPSPAPGIFVLGTQLKSSRALPMETRRTRRVRSANKLEQLRLELMGNDILRAFVNERKHLSDENKITTCRGFLDSAQNTLLTASKIELLRRAFILNASMKSPLKEIEQHTLERLLEHQEFFYEPNLD